MNYVYILKCSDGTLYTGWTNSLQDRILAHNSGKGAKYTRSRGPVLLVYLEEFQEKGPALSREAQIKKLPRQEKLSIIENMDQDTIKKVDEINSQVQAKSSHK